MECPHCGHVNPETNRFCHNCGQSLLAIPAPGPTVVLSSANLEEAGAEMPLLERLEQEGDIPASLPEPPPVDPEIPPAMVPTAQALTTRAGLAAAGYSDAGPQRANNEDHYGVFCRWQMAETLATGEQQQARGFFVVCDGMGGHAGGEVASALAVESLAMQFQPFWDKGMPGVQTLTDIVLEANRVIYQQNEVELRRDYGRMGTTLVLLVVVDNQAAIVHVGDSRIYRVTANQLEQLTRDHEVAEQLIDRGVDPMTARTRPDAHQLTQALGPFESDRIVPTVAFFELTEPSLFVLCSDGVCDYDLIEQNWKHALLPHLAPHTSLRTGAKELVELANQFNGHDNATAVLVRWA
ncbi:MAG TPA: protein phosphatase [Cyanobacteria bacterium UBA8156]|jgi:protein phosphatase|nr:protein phosphatase [Cyanobacteria bacterium UBA8156]